ncbi:MAG: hypothetical protein M0Z50_00355 [Planctomycetia bacterium]|nr:hypothetical protein [Planctomycetia bacterium]
MMDLTISSSSQIQVMLDFIRSNRERINTIGSSVSDLLDNKTEPLDFDLLNIVGTILTSKNQENTKKIPVTLYNNNNITSFEFDEYMSEILRLVIMDDEIHYPDWCSAEDKKRIYNLILMYDSGVISYLYNIIFTKLEAPSISMSWVSGFFISYVALESIIDLCVIGNDVERKNDKIISINYGPLKESKRFTEYAKDNEYIYDLDKKRGDYAHGRIETFGDYKSCCNLWVIKKTREAIMSALKYYYDNPFVGK